MNHQVKQCIVLFTGMLISVHSTAGEAKQPNILFIMSDDHAAHAMSCYGSRINRTPNLDRIADEGVRFNADQKMRVFGNTAYESPQVRRWYLVGDVGQFVVGQVRLHSVINCIRFKIKS